MVSRYLLHLTIKYVSLEVGKMFILCMPSDNDCDQTKSSVDCYEPHTYTWSQVSGLWSVYTEGCMLLEDFLLLIVWKFMIQKIIYGLFYNSAIHFCICLILVNKYYSNIWLIDSEYQIVPIVHYSSQHWLGIQHVQRVSQMMIYHAKLHGWVIIIIAF